MKKLILSHVFFIIVLVGCASVQKHEHARGSIVALDSPKEAHVCMNSSEVNEGEQLSLFQSVCAMKKKKAGKFSEERETTTCTKVPKGTAEVIEKTDTHFIKIKAVNDTIFEDGYIVEKIVK